MKSWFIARCVRNNTYFVRFYTTVNSFSTTLTFATTSIAHILCPGMTPKRRNWIDRVSHLFMRKFTLAKSHYLPAAPQTPLVVYENTRDQLNYPPPFVHQKVLPRSLLYQPLAY